MSSSVIVYIHCQQREAIEVSIYCLGRTNKYSFSYTSTTKETNFSTSSVWSQEVYDLYTGFEDFGCGRLVDETGSLGMNRHLSLA